MAVYIGGGLVEDDAVHGDMSGAMGSCTKYRDFQEERAVDSTGTARSFIGPVSVALALASAWLWP
jgi:hypothetical protein